MASIVIRSSGVEKGEVPMGTRKGRIVRSFPLTVQGQREHDEFVNNLDDVVTRWCVRFRVAGAAARSQTFKSVTTAKNFKRKLEGEHVQGKVFDPKRGRVTLSKEADRWLEERHDLKQTTRSKYRGLLDRHILPDLALRRIADITTEEVRAWYYELRGRVPATADDAYRLLHAIFATAVTDKKVPDNPCQVKGAGRIRSPERPIGTLSDVATATVAVPKKWVGAFVLAVWCSLRRGEVLGLQRQDIDLVAKTVTIRREWVKPETGQPYVSTPKSNAGWRSLTIPDHVLPEIAAHLDAMENKDPTAWLFPNPQGTLPVKPRQFDRVWTAVRQAIGRKDLRLHDLRHTGLTFAAATGATTAELMHRGGHSTMSAAIRYQHASEARDREIAAGLSRLAESVEATPRLDPRQERAIDPEECQGDGEGGAPAAESGLTG